MRPLISPRIRGKQASKIKQFTTEVTRIKMMRQTINSVNSLKILLGSVSAAPFVANNFLLVCENRFANWQNMLLALRGNSICGNLKIGRSNVNSD